MDLNKIVMDSFAKIQAEGFIESTIEKVLKKTLESTIEETFRSYSPFGKQLGKEVNEKLQINLEKLDIAQYNMMVLNAVKEQLDQAVHIQGIAKIQEAMQELLGDVKREYKLSELIEEMKTGVDEDDRPSEISLEIPEDRRVLTHLYFDEQPDLPKYRCKYCISVSEDGTVTRVSIDDKNFHNQVIMGGLYGFEATLFKLYAHGSKLIVDEDQVDRYYPGEDYDRADNQ